MESKYQPPELQPEETAAIQNFMDTKFAHQELITASDQLYSAIISRIYSIILVVGPTRVGKTTLIDRTKNYLVDYAKHDPEFHPGRIPFGGMEIQRDKTFSWPTYFRGKLHALHDVLIDKKVSYGEPEIRVSDDGRLFIGPRIYKPRLEPIVIDTLLRLMS